MRLLESRKWGGEAALAALCSLLIAGTAAAQATPAARVLGTVTSVAASNLSVKTEAGETVAVHLKDGTRLQRVNPGERDLSKVETLRVEDIAAGDRVLVRGSKTWDGFSADSVIVMPAHAIAQRNAADQRAWRERGVFGVVDTVDAAAKTIHLSVRTQGELRLATVTLTPSTTVKRYKPDSIRFADAVPAQISEIHKGDQLRAMGKKDESGASVEAEQVVFGTFRTVAGTVTAVDAAAGVVTLKDLQTNKALTVRTRADSQIKRMGFPGGGMAMRAGGAAAPGASAGRPSTATGGGGFPRAGAGPDLGAMLERMPAIKLDELKTGDTVIVSSTSGVQSDELTAIVLLAGAEPIIAQLTARAQANRGQDPMAAASSLDRGLEGMMGMPIQ